MTLDSFQQPYSYHPSQLGSQSPSGRNEGISFDSLSRATTAKILEFVRDNPVYKKEPLFEMTPLPRADSLSRQYPRSGTSWEDPFKKTALTYTPSELIEKSPVQGLLPDPSSFQFQYPNSATCPVNPDPTFFPFSNFSNGTYPDEPVLSPFNFNNFSNETCPKDPSENQPLYTYCSDALHMFNDESVKRNAQITASCSSALWNIYTIRTESSEMIENLDQFNQISLFASTPARNEILRDLNDKHTRHLLNMAVSTTRVVKPLTYLCPSDPLQKITRGICDLSSDALSLYRYSAVRSPELDRNPNKSWKDTAHTVFKSGISMINLTGNMLFLAHTSGLLEDESSYNTIKAIAFSGMFLDITYEGLQKAGVFAKRSY